LFVHPDVPAKSVKELVAYTRANPGKVNYATVNNGEYLAVTQFVNATGADLVRIPYKQAPMTDLLAGRVQMYVGPVGQGVSHAKEGKLRMLATFFAERSSLAPEVPTMVEQGIANVNGLSYQMFVAPAKTPPD